MFTNLLTQIANQFSFLAIDEPTTPDSASAFDVSGMSSKLSSWGESFGSGGLVNLMYWVGIIMVFVIIGYIILFKIIMPAMKENDKVTWSMVVRDEMWKIGGLLVAGIMFMIVMSLIIA